MKRVLFSTLFLAAISILSSCGGSQPTSTEGASQEAKETADEKGIGPIKEVTLTLPLDQKMIATGKEIFALKCSACHHLDNTKLVGPGWKDVTKRRKPEWIMNFAMNPDEMLNKDAKAMAMLEECLVRMPNQNLSEADARIMVEFMRSNDGVK